MYYLVDFKRRFDKELEKSISYNPKSETFLRDYILDKRQFLRVVNPKIDYTTRRYTKRLGIIGDQKRGKKETVKQYKQKLEDAKSLDRKRDLANKRLELQRKNNLPLSAQEYINSLKSPIDDEYKRSSKLFDKSSTNYTNYLDKKDPSRIPVNSNPQVSKVSEKGKEVISKAPTKQGMSLGKKALIGTAGIAGLGIVAYGLNQLRKSRSDKGRKRGKYRGAF